MEKGSQMIWFMVFQVVSTLVDLIRLGRQSTSEKDLEILLLRLCRLLSPSGAVFRLISP